MSGWGYHDVAADWWPYVFILLAGWLPTDVWRWIGVASAGRIDEKSRLISLARAIATALVAAVIARLVFYPTGFLATLPAAVRVGALAAGFLTYVLLGRRILLGILVAEAILIGVPFLL
ncbi:branched-chain amino acid transport [Aureimonas sp. Leaf454]|uniref:AzlD domain-containing protein n=1 Tax=Aureimonas sp. Leaf454 TaxID=1736381 RepID=UPI0006F35B26|nr:AzlD domain-containing protein [Aureimonas sp. Leaf454]KQT48731.1 branched-chain amino acid transport [Aureimonas sp. Leaf454]